MRARLHQRLFECSLVVMLVLLDGSCRPSSQPVMTVPIEGPDLSRLDDVEDWIVQHLNEHGPMLCRDDSHFGRLRYSKVWIDAEGDLQCAEWL